VWREHVEGHPGGSVVDCTTETCPIVFEADVEAVTELQYSVEHTPESDDPYPLCGHASVFAPVNTPTDARELMKMRLAGTMRHVFGDIDSR
jgi:hypothetical protein